MSEGSEIMEQQKAVKRLLETRGGAYSIPEFYQSGGTRHLYKAIWGPGNGKSRIVKVDRGTLESPRAIRHVGDGCNTENELKSLTSMDYDGTTRVVDYFTAEEASKVGLPGTVLVEEYIPNSQSLEDVVSTGGSLNERDFRRIIGKGIRTIANVVKGNDKTKGRFHRDLKPTNWLVKREGDNVDTYIGDWANSIVVGDVKESNFPTAGGRLYSDPLLMGPFTGKKAKYSVGSEVFALASAAAYAIRGTPIFDYDPDTGKAFARDSGESLLTDGHLDPEKHAKVLRAAMKRLPREFKKYRGVLEKGLTLDSNLRYSSLEDMSRDFERAANKPGFFRKWGVRAGIAGTIAAILGTGLVLEHQASRIDESEAEIKEGKKMAAIADYFEKGNSSSYWNFLEGGELSGWMHKFGDEKTAIAAYLNPNAVYEAIQATGSEDYDSLMRYFMDNHPEVYGRVFEATSGSCIDNIAREIYRDRYNGVDSIWNVAERDYHEKRAKLDAARRNSQVTPMGPILMPTKNDTTKVDTEGEKERVRWP